MSSDECFAHERLNRNLCLHIAYDGTEFHGWQETAMGPSIEGALREVMETILGHPVKLQAASRTDAGVHADHQVVNAFVGNHELDLRQLLLSLNQLLPNTVAATRICGMPAEFHPSLDARGKIYRYRVSLGTYQMPKERLYSWHYPYKIDLRAMHEASRVLIGRHDFAAFTNVHQETVSDTVRELIRVDFDRQNNQLEMIFEGTRFLYRMVRNLVGTLLYTGSGKLAKEDVKKILISRDRRLAGVTAPAHGPTLSEVYYT